MLKAAIILAALAGSGVAAFAATQQADDELFMPVGENPNWFLQRAGCTIARSENGNSDDVIRLQIQMGAHLEVIGHRPRVRNGDTAQIALAVDGVSENSYGIGFEWDDGRSGYRIPISDEMLDRIASGRRLQISAGGRPLRTVDLAGGAPAIAAMRTCQDAAMSEPVSMDNNMVDTNAAGEMAEAAENAAAAAEAAYQNAAMPNAM